MTVEINFFDTNTGPSPYANMHWPAPEIKYVKPPVMNWDGITVFTDELCFHPVVDLVRSKIKIAWAFESPVIKPHVYRDIKKIEDKFDFICISNPESFGPQSKYLKSLFGACWIPEDHCKIYPKTKPLSMVASNKIFAPGHRARHDLVRRYRAGEFPGCPELELWGSAYRPFGDDPVSRTLPFADYMYVIAIENCQYPGYFTDKIVDCFAAGCIPIYWGDPTMKEKFDPRGFYTFNNWKELQEILLKIGEEDYKSKMPYIEENFKRFREYASPDRWMLNNIYVPILNATIK